MSKSQGSPKTGGRQKGTPNKTTTDMRAAIALIAERNVEKFEGWLAAVAKDDPGKAADLFLKAIEYHIPKLARTEMTGKNGGAMNMSLRVLFGKADA